MSDDRYDDLEACVDCAMLIANAETPHYMDEEETEKYLEAIEAIWPSSEWVLAFNCPEDCEGWFSYASCDVCDSRLGGDRHPVAVWRKQ